MLTDDQQQQIAGLRDRMMKKHHKHPELNRHLAEEDPDMLMQQDEGAPIMGMSLSTAASKPSPSGKFFGDSITAAGHLSSVAQALDAQLRTNNANVAAHKTIQAAMPSVVAALSGSGLVPATTANVPAAAPRPLVGAPIATAAVAAKSNNNELQLVRVPFVIAHETTLAELESSAAANRIEVNMSHPLIGADQKVLVKSVVVEEQWTTASTKIGAAFANLEGRRRVLLNEGRVGSSYHSALPIMSQLSSSKPQTVYTGNVDSIEVSRFVRYGKHQNIQELRAGITMVPTQNEAHVPIAHAIGHVMLMPTKSDPNMPNHKFYGAQLRTTEATPTNPAVNYWALPLDACTSLLKQIDQAVYQNNSFQESQLSLNKVPVQFVPINASMSYEPAPLRNESPVVRNAEMTRPVEIYICGYMEVLPLPTAQTQ